MTRIRHGLLLHTFARWWRENQLLALPGSNFLCVARDYRWIDSNTWNPRFLAAMKSSGSARQTNAHRQACQHNGGGSTAFQCRVPRAGPLGHATVASSANPVPDLDRNPPLPTGMPVGESASPAPARIGARTQRASECAAGANRGPNRQIRCAAHAAVVRGAIPPRPRKPTLVKPSQPAAGLLWSGPDAALRPGSKVGPLATERESDLLSCHHDGASTATTRSLRC